MRHAEAESGEPNNPTRPLTEAGRKQLACMGAFMSRIEGRVDCIITSYFVRALDTAKAMSAALGCTVIHETPWLCPDAPVEKAWQDLQRLGKNSETVLVVTHHPLINELLKRACGNADSHFEHAGIARIKDSTLHWFVSPKLIARDESDAAVIEAALQVIDSSIRELDAGNIWDIDRIPEAMLVEAGKYTYEETLMKRVLPGPSASGTCEFCEDNIDAGWIDSEELYPTGDDGPGFHPNCACEEFYRVGRVRVYESGLRVREGWAVEAFQASIASGIWSIVRV
jgi:phosphohistidine phosphatase SixA